MHLSRVLMALDREAEAQQCLEKFRKIPAGQPKDPRKEAGMIELATLPVAEQTQRQIDRLRKEAHEHPNQPELQLRLAQLLLRDGRLEEATAAFRELLTRNAESRIWEEAGTSLVRSEQYELGAEFLRRAAPERPAAYLELAIALSVTSGPQEALKVLERAPEAERGGDFLLLKARLLDTSGQKVEAEKALQAGLRQSSPRPQVAQQAALLLLSRDRQKEALLLLDQSIRAAPSNADLRLMRAIVLGLMGRTQEAESALKETESRWPEWDRPYLVHGLLLEGSGRKAEARQKLQTVGALNAQDLAARCALARLAASAAPEARCACVGGLRELLFPSCGESVVR